MHSILKDFLTMIDVKLLTKRRFHLALLEINRYLKSIAEGIQFAKSVRFLKDCYNWAFDRWMDSYSKVNVQRHGLLDARCRVYFLNIMKMSEKRGREVFGPDGWEEKKGKRAKLLQKLCDDVKSEYYHVMKDVDSCVYTVLEQVKVPVDSYTLHV